MPDLARRRWLAALAGAALLAGCRRQRRRDRYPQLPAGSVVLALGDSITHGSGADAASAYPALLAAQTGWQVVNAGVPGDTAAQALQRLPALLAEHRPAAVLVSIGGNDFLRRLPDEQTHAAIDAIVDAVRQAGALPVLIGVPRPTLLGAATASLSDHPLYAEIAAAREVPLAGGLWSAVLADERLRSDRIHANGAGYRAFAGALQQRLAELGIAP